MRARTLRFLFLWVPISLLLVSCSNETTNSGKWIKQTPEDLGVIAESFTKANLTSLRETYPEAQVLKLAPNHNIFEIKNLKIETLQKSFPQALFTTNKIVKSQNIFEKKLSPKEQIAKVGNSLGKSSKLSRILDKIKSCKEGFSLPKIVTNITYPKNSYSESVHLENAIIEIDATRSNSNFWVGGDIDVFYSVDRPEGAVIDDILLEGDKTSIRLDSVGIYHVVVWAKDRRDVCETKSIILNVTSNDEYGLQSSLSHSPIFPDFKHLNELETKKAWKINKGENTLVAVIDSGVNYNHPFLSSRIWKNPAEIDGNNIDDDGNGFIDDLYGWDFVFDDNRPFDDKGHGSHVAGLVAGFNFGSAPSAKILAIKSLGFKFYDWGSVVGGIYYAVDLGADIINMSLGFSYRNEFQAGSLLKNAMKYAHENNVLIVTTSGNGDKIYGKGYDNDSNTVFQAPTDFNFSNILAVGASSMFNDDLTYYSNFGLKTVDVVAPGGDLKDPDTGDLIEGHLIVSATPKNTEQILFTEKQGTSMAAPLVAGIAAQVMSMKPTWQPYHVINHLVNTGLDNPNLKNKVKSGKNMNALMAIENF